jgi:Ca2+-transporting ATPase
MNYARHWLRSHPLNAMLFRPAALALFESPVYLLLAALALDLGAWFEAGARGAPVEALAILAVLLLNAGLGVLQEYRSERAIDELARLGSPQVWVRRDGALERIFMPRTD